MSVLVIVNPVSGRRSLGDTVRRVVDRLCEAGCPASVRVTWAAGRAGKLAGKAPQDTRAILIVGGDGTVREVIDGMLAAGRHVPLVILRNGTENLVAKELHQPTRPKIIARTLLDGHPIVCDVGQINDRHFLLVAGAGFDAEVVHRLAMGRNGHITHADYFWPIWRTFWTHRFPRLRVYADDALVFDGHGMAFVGLMARYSVGLRILRRAWPGDGMLDLCVMDCDNRMRLLHLATQVLRQDHDRSAGVIYRKCLTVRIESDDCVPMETDGDRGGFLPASLSVLPSACTFLLPPARKDAWLRPVQPLAGEPVDARGPE